MLARHRRGTRFLSLFDSRRFITLNRGGLIPLHRWRLIPLHCRRLVPLRCRRLVSAHCLRIEAWRLGRLVTLQWRGLVTRLRDYVRRGIVSYGLRLLPALDSQILTIVDYTR